MSDRRSTKREVNLDRRYRVYADLTNGKQGFLVMSYDDSDLADHAATMLNATVPGSFVDRAWVEDTEES